MAVTAMDLDADGRDELVVSAPYHTVDSAYRTGAVLILPGSVLGAISGTSQFWHQDLDEVPGANESSDLFGRSLLK